MLAKLGHITYVKAYRYFGRYGTNHEAIMVKGENGTARFNGLCWGYGGEGPSGTCELLLKLGLTVAEAQMMAYNKPRRDFNQLGVDWEIFFGDKPASEAA